MKCSIAALLALPLALALAACEGAPVVLAIPDTHDAQAEASTELGSDAAPDAPGRDGDAGGPDIGSADVSTPSDAGADAPADDAPTEDAGADAAPPDEGSTSCDGGACTLPDGATCYTASYYGCVPDPGQLCSDWQLVAYTCAKTPPGGCYQETPQAFYCCDPAQLCL